MFSQSSSSTTPASGAEQSLKDYFASYPVTYRKVFWMILRAQVDINHQKNITTHLEDHQNGESYQRYLLFRKQLAAYLSPTNIKEYTSAFSPIDFEAESAIKNAEKFLEIETGIYQFLEANQALSAFLKAEIDKENSELHMFTNIHHYYLLCARYSNKDAIEEFFDEMPYANKWALWKALAAPYRKVEYEGLNGWLEHGKGCVLKSDILKFDSDFRAILAKNKVDMKKFEEAISEAASDMARDVDDKIINFFEEYFPVFEFLVAEFNKEPEEIQPIDLEDDGYIPPLLKILLELNDFFSLEEAPAEIKQPYTKLRSGLREHKVTPLTLLDPGNSSVVWKLSGKENDNSLPATLNVRSIGFDNALFNKEYLHCQLKNKPTFINTNAVFIQHVIEDMKEQNYENVIFMNGSARQSYPFDEAASNHIDHETQQKLVTESSFVALLWLVQHMQALSPEMKKICCLDGYLLADTFCRFENGKVFAEGITKELCQDDFDSAVVAAVCPDDKSYIFLLYAQMHKIASENPQKKIKFDFYMGSGSKIKVIADFLTRNSYIIPGNILFSAYIYNGAEIYKMLEVVNVSHGLIDYNYKINLLKMMECCNGPDPVYTMPLVTASMDSDSVATEPYEEESIVIQPAAVEVVAEETVFSMETDEKNAEEKDDIMEALTKEIEDEELAGLLPIVRSPRTSRRAGWTRHDENNPESRLKVQKVKSDIILLANDDVEEDMDPISIVSRRKLSTGNLFYAAPSCKSYTVSLFASQKLVSSIFEKVRCLEVRSDREADEKEDKPECKKARHG